MGDDHRVGIGGVDILLHAAGAVVTSPHAGGQAPHAQGGILHIGHQVPGLLRGIYIGHLHARISQVQILQDLHLLVLPNPHNGRDAGRVRCPDDVAQLFPVHRHMLCIQYEEVEPRQGQQLRNRRIRQLHKGADGTLAIANLLLEHILAHLYDFLLCKLQVPGRGRISGQRVRCLTLEKPPPSPEKDSAE